MPHSISYLAMAIAVSERRASIIDLRMDDSGLALGDRHRYGGIRDERYPKDDHGKGTDEGCGEEIQHRIHRLVVGSFDTYEDDRMRSHVPLGWGRGICGVKSATKWSGSKAAVTE